VVLVGTFTDSRVSEELAPALEEIEAAIENKLAPHVSLTPVVCPVSCINNDGELGPLRIAFVL